MSTFPTDSDERKEAPMATGVIDYFPDALLAIAQLSWIGNEKHNPGQHLHWSRGKSDDHPDCLMRHFTERGKVDTDKVRHSVKVAWRALAILQLELEEAAAPTSRYPDELTVDPTKQHKLVDDERHHLPYKEALSGGPTVETYGNIVGGTD